MSNYDKLTALGIPVKRREGSEKTACPQCSHTRKNKNDRCLSVDITEGVYNCHHCGWKGNVRSAKEQKLYFRPVWQNNTNLSDKVVKWFKDRKISQQTLIDLKVTEGVEFMPQTGKDMNTIQFNYFRGEELVNTKFRTGAKDFKMVKDAELILYNLNSVKTQSERITAIICEGEMDCLSFIESGLKHALSVPNGASKGNNNLTYLDNCYDELEQVERFYIAVDNDEAGLSLRDELVRRLGSERCYLVDFNDCKDANEYLIKYGAIELAKTIEEARPCDLTGIIYASALHAEYVDLYDRGLPPGDKIDLREFDDLASFVPAQLTIVTGVPQHGKSDFVDQIALRLALKGWRFGVYSPENYPTQLHLSKLSEKIVGQSFRHVHGNGRMTLTQAEKSLDFINEHFYFINPSDEDTSLENILKHAKKLVRRYGIKGMIIDPWNKLDHQYTVSETQYISRSLDMLIKFNQANGVHTFLVAHPTKLQKDKASGRIEIPNLYQISGSAHFYNKADNGFVVYRYFSDNPDERKTEIHVQKFKFKHLGTQGVATTKYDTLCGRFNWHGNAGFDRQSWLVEQSNSAIQPNINFSNEKHEQTDDFPF